MKLTNDHIVNVLHLIDHYRIGGPGKTIINSAKYIDQTKFRIHVSSFVGSNNKQNEFSQAIDKGGVIACAFNE